MSSQLDSIDIKNLTEKLNEQSRSRNSSPENWDYRKNYNFKRLKECKEEINDQFSQNINNNQTSQKQLGIMRPESCPNKHITINNPYQMQLKDNPNPKEQQFDLHFTHTPTRRESENTTHYNLKISNIKEAKEMSQFNDTLTNIKDDFQSTQQTSNLNHTRVKSDQLTENLSNQVKFQDKHKERKTSKYAHKNDMYLENAHLKKKFRIPVRNELFDKKAGGSLPANPLQYTSKMRNVTSPDRNNGQTFYNNNVYYNKTNIPFRSGHKDISDSVKLSKYADKSATKIIAEFTATEDQQSLQHTKQPNMIKSNSQSDFLQRNKIPSRYNEEQSAHIRSRRNSIENSLDNSFTKNNDISGINLNNSTDSLDLGNDKFMKPKSKKLSGHVRSKTVSNRPFIHTHVNKEFNHIRPDMMDHTIKISNHNQIYRDLFRELDKKNRYKLIPFVELHNWKETEFKLTSLQNNQHGLFQLPQKAQVKRSKTRSNSNSREGTTEKLARMTTNLESNSIKSNSSKNIENKSNSSKNIANKSNSSKNM